MASTHSFDHSGILITKASALQLKILDGIYGSFYLEHPTRNVSHAERLLEYFDRKYPIAYAAIGRNVESEAKVRIRFVEGGGASTNTIERRIDWGIENSSLDLGGMIHETMHIVQSYPNHIYAEFRPLVEGMADFYRVVLSDDAMGDIGDERKKFLVESADSADEYDFGAEFYAFLLSNFGGKAFEQHLDEAFRSGDSSTVKAVFAGVSNGYHWQGVRSDYIENRDAILGGQPSLTLRAEHFKKAINS